MAGKEHIIGFVLNASLNGNFKGAFNNAQSEFTKLGREIQELHRLQGNISSYQKQEQAIASTTQKLSNLQQQEALLVQQIDAAKNAENQDAAAIAGLEREKLKLEQRIANTTTALERQNQKFDATGKKLQEAGVNTNNLTGESQRLAAQMQELSKRQEEAANSAQNFGAQAAQGFQAVQSAIVAAGIADKLGEIKDAYLECVSVAANFEESMSTVEALSGSTAQEMAELTATAKDLGATTKYTALQAADAMGYMGMAGWKAQEMMAGMDGVINLAAASGEDLAMVSDIVTDNLTAFGMTAADTARFSDVLAAAATNSNTSVSVMGETFKQSASIAGALGYSIEDVAVGVGLMANAGVKGSIAGTALKNTFNGLLEGATLTAEAFGDYDFTAIKADGTMKSFSDTINELRIYFEQMTEAERVNNAMALAGQRGYNGLLAILNATDADYAKLTDSINNCTGAAKRMADIKLDNLNGQLTLMGSAWEAVQTTIGEEFNPELRRLAEFGTDALGWINSFIQDHPALVKGVMAATGAIGGLVVGITGVTAAMKLASIASGVFAGTMGVALGPVLGVAAAVAGVVGVVTALHTATDASVPSVKELTEAARDMKDVMAEAGDAYEQTTDQTLAAAEVANIYIDKLEEIEAATQGNVEGNQEYQNVLALLLRTMPELSDSISETTDEYGRSVYTLETSTAALRRNAVELKNNAQAQAYQQYINTLYDQYGSVMLEAAENSIKLTQAQTRMETAEKNHAAAVERMNELERQAAENGGDLTEEYLALQNSLNGYVAEMYDAQKEIDAYTKAMDSDAEAVAAAEDEIAQAEKAVENLTGAMEEASGSTLPELDSALYSVQEQMAALSSAYDNAYGDAYESINGQIGLFEEMTVKVDTSVNGMISSLQSQISFMATYSENLQKAADMGLSEGLLARLSDGSTESAAYLQAIVDGGEQKIEELNAAFAQVEEGKEAFSGTVAEIQIGLDDALTEMEQNVQESVEAMALPDEAAQSARETIQAFIDQAGQMRPWVQKAYAELAQTAAGALGVDLYSTSRGHSGDAGDHLAGAFASGTSNAPPGWAWVGEEGPELIRMRGGETVLPAEISRKFAFLSAYKDGAAAYANGTGNAAAVMAEAERLTEVSNTAYADYSEAVYNNAAYNTIARGDYTAYASPPEAAISTAGAVEAAPAPSGGADPVKVEVHIHLEGSAAPETVQALEEYVSRGELQEAVENTIRNMQADARRRDWF